jgi:hypothetical protein
MLANQIEYLLMFQELFVVVIFAIYMFFRQTNLFKKLEKNKIYEPEFTKLDKRISCLESEVASIKKILITIETKCKFFII